MKFIIFFIFVPLVHSGFHSFITTYTGISGQTTAGTPEFSAVTTLDGHQIDYYDSDIQKLIPKQDWMKRFASEELWNRNTRIRNRDQQICKYIIPVIMQEFNQSHGLHTYQRMYGCAWNDETEETQGFDQYSYDGEDFISLDLKELRYIASVPQGFPTTQKWNNDTTRLDYLKQYYNNECIEWMKRFLALRKDVERRAPQVSLLQKDPSSPVVCHATGFYPSGITITWLRNGVEQHEDVYHGETLPNEDGTFQKRSTLRVLPDDRKKSQYTCVVEHQEKTFQKTDDEIKSNYIPIFTILVCVMGGLMVPFTCFVFWILLKKRTHGFQPVPCDSDEFPFIDKSL